MMPSTKNVFAEPLSAAQIKRLLDPFVDEHERDFHVVISRRKTRICNGTYAVRSKTITLYRSRTATIPLIGTALHELSHHLVWSRKREWLLELRRQSKRQPAHGKDFADIQSDLLRAFNSRYSKRLKGMLVFDRRRPSLPGRFVDDPVEMILEILEEHRASLPPAKRRSYWRKFARSFNRGRAIAAAHRDL